MFNIGRFFLFIFLVMSNNAFSRGSEFMVKQQINQALQNQLPAHILESKQMIAVNDGSVPPYIIYEEDGNLVGLSVDLFDAISQVLGISIKHEKIAGIGGILLGVQSGRYDLGIGPLADLPERQIRNDFLAYTISYDAIAVRKGNPQQIYSFTDFCGRRIGIELGGIEYYESIQQTCAKEGKPAINLHTFPDLSGVVLALKSGRIDAFGTSLSIIASLVSQSNGELELVTAQPSDQDFRYYSAVLAKDSSLSPIILAALQELYANGTYAEIMKKWNMEAAMLEKPGINLAR